MALANDSKDDKLKIGGATLRLSEWTEQGRIRRHWTYQKIGREQPEETKETPVERTVPRKPAEEQKRITPLQAKKKEQAEEPTRQEEEKKQMGNVGQEVADKVDGLMVLVQQLAKKISHIEASVGQVTRPDGVQVSEIQHARKGPVRPKTHSMPRSKPAQELPRSAEPP